jgi:hypothetical protein
MLRGKLKTYHSSDRLLVADPDSMAALHTGTKKSALQRFYDREMNMGSGYSSDEARGYLHEMMIDVRKPLLLRGAWGGTKKRRRQYGKSTIPEEMYGALHERIHRVGSSKKLRQRLARRGYDVLPYVNFAEDKGSVSYLVLDPAKIDIKRVVDLRVKLKAANTRPPDREKKVKTSYAKRGKKTRKYKNA